MQKPYPLALKPDLEEAARRWDAFFAGDILDRPVVRVTAPVSGRPGVKCPGYRENVFGDLDEVIGQAIAWAESIYWGGEAVPHYSPDFAPDGIAVFCGAGLKWHADIQETNWCVPFIDDWKKDLPLRLQKDNLLWQRMLEFYRRASQRMAGKVLLTHLDLHTNLDLLAGVRGNQQLCMDLIDQPELIDRAMQDARAVFRELWPAIVQAGRMDELGYCHAFYSMEGTAILACDFSALISPAMFQRWAVPALEEEAGIVKHAFYHWDGPGAVKHMKNILSIKGIHTIGYCPNPDRENPLEYVELYQIVQSGGKAVEVHGSPEQIKQIHPQLRPEKVLYSTEAKSPAEAEQLLEWFVKNT